MFSIIIRLSFFALAIVVAFLITRMMFMLWTGADKEEATKKFGHL